MKISVESKVKEALNGMRVSSKMNMVTVKLTTRYKTALIMAMYVSRILGPELIILIACSKLYTLMSVGSKDPTLIEMSDSSWNFRSP